MEVNGSLGASQTVASQRFRSPWAHLLWALPLVALTVPTAVFLWDKWTRNIWLSGHGVFVPLLVVFLCYYALKREPVKEEQPSAWGFAFLGSGLLMLVADSAIETELLSAIALLWSLPGFSLLLLGPRRTRVLLFPWMLSFMMLPIPSAFLVPVHNVLRSASSVGAVWVLELLQIPVFAQGTTLHLSRSTFVVVEECSGFSALYSAVTIGLVLTYMTNSWKRRILLLLAPLPLTLAFNSIRVATLVALANAMGLEILDTALHPLTGWVTFMASSLGMFALADYRPDGGSG